MIYSQKEIFYPSLKIQVICMFFIHDLLKLSFEINTIEKIDLLL